MIQSRTLKQLSTGTFSLKRGVGTATATVLLCFGMLGPLSAQPASPASAPAPGQRLTLCYERADIKPWRRTDDTGLNFDLLRMAARRAQIDVEFVNLPWKRCLLQLQTNEVQGVFAASFQPDRLALGAYPGGETPDASKRLHVDRYVLVRRKGEAVSWDGSQITQLQGSIGAQLGYSVVQALRAMKLSVDDGSQTAPELLKKLQAGRIGAAALGGSDALALLGPDSPLSAQFEVLPQPLTEKPYFLLLSHQLLKSDVRLALRFWGSIGEARQSPAYQALEREAHAKLQ